MLFIKNPLDVLKNGYNVFPTKIWLSQTWPGLGTDRNPQDQIENKLPEIVCVLVNAPTEFLDYLKLTEVLHILLSGHSDTHCDIANQHDVYV